MLLFLCYTPQGRRVDLRARLHEFHNLILNVGNGQHYAPVALRQVKVLSHVPMARVTEHAGRVSMYKIPI